MGNILLAALVNVRCTLPDSKTTGVDIHQAAVYVALSAYTN